MYTRQQQQEAMSEAQRRKPATAQEVRDLRAAKLDAREALAAAQTSGDYERISWAKDDCLTTDAAYDDIMKNRGGALAEAQEHAEQARAEQEKRTQAAADEMASLKQAELKAMLLIRWQAAGGDASTFEHVYPNLLQAYLTRQTVGD